jgi:hypothetical protein
MDPVRVKLYGLFPVTKRRYVAQVVVAGVLVAILLSVWIFYRVNLRGQLGAIDSPLLGLVVGFFDLIPWIVAGFVVLQTLEAWLVLRAFARKQPPAATPPAPPAQP